MKGHKSNKCPNEPGAAVLVQQSKFLDNQDFSDPLVHVRDGAAAEVVSDDTSDSDSESDTMTNDENDNLMVAQTPVKSRPPAKKKQRLGF